MANIARDANFAKLKRSVAELKDIINSLEDNYDAIYKWDEEPQSKALAKMIVANSKQIRELIDSVYIRG